jgi:hypothetical protein
MARSERDRVILSRLNSGTGTWVRPHRNARGTAMAGERVILAVLLRAAGFALARDAWGVARIVKATGGMPVPREEESRRQETESRIQKTGGRIGQ